MTTFLYWSLLLLLVAVGAGEVWRGRFEAAIGIAVTAALLAVLGPVYTRLIRPWNERVSRDRLLEWITDRERDIRHGGAMREGVRVVPDTRLVRFEIVYSLVYFSRRTATNHYLAGTPHAFLVGLTATLFTAVFGWWAVPWGIINTVRVLGRNLRGADSTTAGEVLAVDGTDPPASQA